MKMLPLSVLAAAMMPLALAAPAKISISNNIIDQSLLREERTDIANTTFFPRNVNKLDVEIGSGKQNAGKHTPDEIKGAVADAILLLTGHGNTQKFFDYHVSRPCKKKSPLIWHLIHPERECPAELTIRVPSYSISSPEARDILMTIVSRIAYEMISSSKNCWKYYDFGTYCNLNDFIKVTTPEGDHIHVTFVSQEMQNWGTFDCPGMVTPVHNALDRLGGYVNEDSSARYWANHEAGWGRHIHCNKYIISR